MSLDIKRILDQVIDSDDLQAISEGITYEEAEEYVEPVYENQEYQTPCETEESTSVMGIFESALAAGVGAMGLRNFVNKRK